MGYNFEFLRIESLFYNNVLIVGLIFDNTVEEIKAINDKLAKNKLYMQSMRMRITGRLLNQQGVKGFLGGRFVILYTVGTTMVVEQILNIVLHNDYLRNRSLMLGVWDKKERAFFSVEEYMLKRDKGSIKSFVPLVVKISREVIANCIRIWVMFCVLVYKKDSL
jgi:hypothetical protein